MKQKKKNKIFTFIWSLVPGAAEMYMGFMKQGLSIMVIFCLSIMVPCVIGASDVFILIPFLVWFYSFFHARNLAACEDEMFEQLSDSYIWEDFLDGREIHFPSGVTRKWIAIILIVLGATLLWENVSYFILALIPQNLWEQMYWMMDKVPGVVIALLIIGIGIHMIRGKMERLDGVE